MTDGTGLSAAVTSGAEDRLRELSRGSSRTRFGPRQGASNLHFAAQFAAVFGVVIPLILVRRPVETFTYAPGVLCFALGVFAATRLGLTLSKGRQYMTITFYLFVWLWFGLVGLIQLDANFFAFPENYLGRTFSQQTRLAAIAVIWLGVGAYELGLLIARSVTPRTPAIVRILSPARVRILSVVALVFGSFVLLQEGPATLFSSREEFAGAFSDGEGGYLTLMRAVGFRLLPLVAAYATLVIVFQPGGITWHHLRLKHKTLAIAIIGFSLLVNNIMTASRNLIGMMLLAFAFAAIPPSRLWLRRSVFVGLITSILFIYPLANHFRRIDPSGYRSKDLYEELIRSHNFTQYGQVHVAIEYVNQVGPRLGRQFSTVLLFFVPRSVWTAKAPDTGSLMHDALGYPERLNESSPLWAEFYVDGGAPLVIVGFLIYGVMTAWLQRTAAAAGPLSLAGFIMPMVAANQLYLLRGSLLGFIPRFTVLLVLLVVVTRSARSATQILQSR